MVRSIILGLIIATLLGACVRVYKIDVQQGNDLSADQVSQIVVGMTQKEVRALLGTPLIDDPFHADRWDYYYASRVGHSRESERRQFSLFFEDGRLARTSGGVDTEQTRATRIDLEELDQGLRGKPQKEKKPGFWERLRRSDEESAEASEES